MIARHKIIFTLHKVFGKTPGINFIFNSFYRYVIFNFVKLHLHFFFPNLLAVIYRNSVIKPHDFSAFLSDLDITLVIKDDSDPLPILRAYLKLKKVLIMLDYPEIYFQREFDHLSSLLNQDTNKLIDLFWHIRKINWNLDSLKANSDELNLIKKHRSIKKSLQKILVNPEEISKDYSFKIEELNHIRKFVPEDKADKTLCYWSLFLETNHRDHIKILLTTGQYPYFNSLMPGEIVPKKIKNLINQDYLMNKSALEIHEIYLCKSVIRLNLARGETIEAQSRWLDWIKHLEVSQSQPTELID